MQVVRYDIQIKNNATDEVRTYTDDRYVDLHGYPDERDVINRWRDGNYQCDCNRALFFGYAIGLKYEDMDTECGDGGYSVNILKGDECIYSEF